MHSYAIFIHLCKKKISNFRHKHLRKSVHIYLIAMIIYIHNTFWFLFQLYLWTRVGRQKTLYFLAKINLITFNKSNRIHLKKDLQ